MPTTESRLGRTGLIIGHVAGMVDLVALPLWVGSLMEHYRFGAQRAGVTVMLFMISVVGSSLLFAPRFDRLPRRRMATAGYALAALAFAAATTLPLGPASFVPLAALHVAAGLGVGCGLSMTHGCMGRSANPHASFALAGTFVGLFAVCYLGSMPSLLRRSPSALFAVFALLMASAALAVCAAFPDVRRINEHARSADDANAAAPIGKPAWFAIGTVIGMALNQAMVFAYLERIGMSRGFGAERVNGVLLALGLINLTPAFAAALLQKRLPSQRVALIAPIIQAALALIISTSTSFPPYAAAASVFVTVVIFTHVFLFGLIASLDPSGRAVAATPAMMMLGSAIGPGLGGAVVDATGYEGIGVVSAVVGLGAMLCMSRVAKALAGRSSTSGRVDSGMAPARGPSA